MKGLTWLVMVLALAPAAAMAQGRPGEGRPPAEARQERRAELERQVRGRFIAQVGQRLGLTEEQRTRLHGVLEEGAEARRALAADGRALRMRLMTAVRSDATPTSTYEEILAGLRDLRAREQALEEREAAALSRFMDARQQAMFLMMRMQLNERIRRMQGPPAGRGRGGGMGGGMGGDMGG